MTDLSWLDHFLLATAGAVITAVIPVVALFATRMLHLSTGSALSTDLDNAIQAGARIALDELTSIAAHNTTVTIKNAAVAKAVQYVQMAAPAALASLNVTPESVGAMISGEVSKVLDTVPPAKVDSFPVDPATRAVQASVPTSLAVGAAGVLS